MNLYGINYTVCNIGSVYNNDNTNTNLLMPGENRFKFDNDPAYTAIPCYSDNSSGTYYYQSVNSSGRCTSSYRSDWYYYPAISTYVEFYYKIND